MTPKTKAKMDEIVAYAREGHDVYPFMFQPMFGTNASVSSAIRAAKKLGLIEEAGIDGVGKPFYRAVMPKPTHTAPATAH